ncbi:hypothetical protein JCM8115_006830 [Rhodotorula mucilaginosa]|uniref:Uncharacterized protein n=1 Tax=Rhodotorula mucilaginosa TaxID=5537 RepID=A0A9P7B7J3_RHOMI|nr:hypothetical protein C6P46_003354 [Rhodotorula mucilaginosa]TKA54116.1 hypothetical protein B0A53_03493 [Rhodotorula sp. CCFEE 5036]
MADTDSGTADATLAHEAADAPVATTTQPTSTSTATSAPVLAPPIDFTKLGGISHATTDTGGYSVPSTATTVSEPTAPNPAPAATTASDQEKKDVVDLVTGTGPGPAPAHPAEAAVNPSQPEPRTDVAVPQPPSPPAAPRSVAVPDEAELQPKTSEVVVPPTDKAPAPAVEPAPPAAQAVSSQDAAPKPAVEAAPVQLADADAVPPPPPRSEPVPVAAQPAPVVDSTAARAPTGPTVVPNDGALSAAPPAVSKPIVPAAESHLAEHPATETDTDHVLPLGQQVHPVHQAAALQDAPDSLVNAQVEKQKADKRELYGEAPKGTIVPGMEDDKLWTMLRRFDAQVLHTLTPPTSLPKGEPDLRPSTLPAVPFEPDLLKGNLMRVYATVGVWGIYGARELMRLMSWAPENRRRTAIWCTAYFICAALRMVLPAVFLLIACLIAYPASRKVLFPPVPPPAGVPPSATDPLNQKGDESLIAGVNHPIEHRSRSEQIEEQAWEFTNLIQRFGARVVVGGKAGGRQGNADVGRKMHVDQPDDDDDDDDLDDEEQDLHEVAQQDGLGAAADKERKEKKLSDKQKRKQKAKEAKVKRDAMIGSAAKTTQDVLGTIADLAEVFANAITPPKPYPPYHAREALATQVLLPLAIVFAIMPARYWTMLVSFGFGFAFFGQPLIKQGFELLQEKVPDWKEKIDLRNTLFSHVPTNAQVVLHIIRVAERHYTPFPLPPAPPTAQDMKEAVQSGGFDEDEMGAAGYSAGDTNQHSVEAGPLANQTLDEDEAEGDGNSTQGKKASGHGKIVGAFRKVAKKAAVFRGDVHVEGEPTTKQKVGNKIDRLLHHSRAKDEMTPYSFPAKYDGTSGHLIVKHSPALAQSTISFIPLKASFQHPTFEYPIEDLVEMKKHGVWIGRTVLGWAASINLEGMGMEMRFKKLEQRWAEKAQGGIGEGDKPHEELSSGETLSFSHVGRRDELFRRLLGISNARWEVL